MVPLRWIGVAGWVTAALFATAALGVAGATTGPFPEWLHIAGHFALCGGCAAAVATAARGSDPVRATVGLAAGLALGAAVEVVQVGWQPTLEVVHDLGIDATGAALGVIAWGVRPASRANAVGHVLSWVFHPAWLAPVALYALAYAAARDAWAAAQFAASAALCLGPAVVIWLLGWRRGWWTDPDLSERSERPALFGLGVLGVLVWFGWLGQGAPVLRDLAALGLVAAVLGAGATAAGLKVSGHVAIPASIGFGMVAFSERGPLLLLGPAVVLSWARLAANRHRGFEVVAAWALAALLGVAGGWFVGR